MGCRACLLSQLFGSDLLLVQMPLQRRVAVCQAAALLLARFQRRTCLLCCCMRRLCTMQLCHRPTGAVKVSMADSYRSGLDRLCCCLAVRMHVPALIRRYAPTSAWGPRYGFRGCWQAIINRAAPAVAARAVPNLLQTGPCCRQRLLRALQKADAAPKAAFLQCCSCLHLLHLLHS